MTGWSCPWNMFSTDPCTERGVSFKLKIDWRPSSRCAADLTEGRSQDPQNLDISDKMVTTTSFHLEHWKFDPSGWGQKDITSAEKEAR